MGRTQQSRNRAANESKTAKSTETSYSTLGVIGLNASEEMDIAGA